MKPIINIINQVFEIEKKGAGAAIDRNLSRIKAELENLGYSYHNPAGETWNETRTDCEASISGAVKAKMTVTEVIKPVVYQWADGQKKIVQKAIVVVE